MTFSMIGPWTEASWGSPGPLKWSWYPCRSPHHLIFHNAAGTHSHHSRPWYYCHSQQVWGHLTNLFQQLVPLQTCSYSDETRWQHCLPDNLWLFGEQGGFWLGGWHPQFIGLRVSNQPFPQTLTMGPLLWAFLIKGESVWCQLQVWRCVAPSLNQGTGLEASSLQWVPWLHPQWLPHRGVS